MLRQAPTTAELLNRHSCFARQAASVSCSSTWALHVQDYNNVDVSVADLLVNGRKLHFLAADVGQNLRLFSYEQQHPDTWRGKKLLPLCALPSLLPQFCITFCVYCCF